MGRGRVEVRRRLVAAFSLYVLAFLRMVAVVVWFNKRSKVRRRILCTMVHNNRIKRRCWVWDDESKRTQCWWDTIVPLFDDERWIQHFRMTQATFWDVVALVEDDMKPGSFNIREPLPTEKRVAMAIITLATGQEFYKIGELFGTHRATINLYFHRFCQSLLKKSGDYVKMPTDADMRETAERLSEEWKCPNIFGAVGGAHFTIKSPEKRKTPNTNSLGTGSMMVQAVVDDKYKFLDIAIMRGGLDKASALAESDLTQKAESFPKVVSSTEGTDVPLMLVGGTEYPLLPWLLTPYQGRRLTPEQESFNIHINNICLLVNNTFERLRARWQILQRKLIVNPKTVPRTIAACCILHNISEAANAPVSTDWYEPTDPLQPLDMACKDVSDEGATTRDTLCQHLAEKYPLLKKDVVVEIDWSRDAEDEGDEEWLMNTETQ